MMETIIYSVLFCFLLVTLHVAGVQSDEEGNVRLVDGLSSKGRVEIFHDGEWGTVCNHYWDLADARVVCRQLGYETAWFPRNTYGSGDSSQPIWLNRVNCTGDEEELSDCVTSDWGDNSCSHSEDAAATCTNDQEIDGYIRLVDAKNNAEGGRVEIYHDGVWGSICNDSWGYEEARVVCRQVGGYYVAWPFQIPFYGPDNGPVHLSNVECTGWESRLIYCPHLQWVENNCSNTNVVGVQCSDSNDWPSEPTTPMTLPPPETTTGMAWWLILIIVVSSLIVVGLIITFIVLCCVCNSQQSSQNIASTQGYPTAATVSSTGNAQIIPPPSYSNTMAYDARTEKAGLEQAYATKP